FGTGLPKTDVFAVSSVSSGHVTNPAVAMDSNGDFVITWQRGAEPSPPFASDDVVVRSFDARGRPLGAEELVTPTSDGDQSQPDVAMDLAGNYVVVWRDDDLSGSP